MNLLHVTPFSVWKKKILRQGLIPKVVKRGLYGTSSRQKRIYFFVDRDTAEDALQNWMVDEFSGVRWFAVLTVRLRKNYELFEDPELSGAVYGTEPIPVSWITSLEKVDAGEPDE